MNVDTDSFAVRGMPRFLKDTEILMRRIQSLSLAEARALWKCNDALAEPKFPAFSRYGSGTPADSGGDGL